MKNLLARLCFLLAFCHAPTLLSAQEGGASKSPYSSQKTIGQGQELWYESPFLWIGAALFIALTGYLIYKRSKQAYT
ncbi:hypothetical protein [Phaeodactylibacter luteus]|uniref:LPXTG cell wall anchor domain-containing protein n=1 Tax=Phaeodactylibacter luteus TaxID=1564516 RepID=A0A5C6RU50_9BACT|nr:hypothetical protein [Phaeodactylibacter luteus]TXB65539.1 hypothetical protein FRY97_06040 [Phaeodactylibacter luteus]